MLSSTDDIQAEMAMNLPAIDLITVRAGASLNMNARALLFSQFLMLKMIEPIAIDDAKAPVIDLF